MGSRGEQAPATVRDALTQGPYRLKPDAPGLKSLAWWDCDKAARDSWEPRSWSAPGPIGQQIPTGPSVATRGCRLGATVPAAPPPWTLCRPVGLAPAHRPQGPGYPRPAAEVGSPRKRPEQGTSPERPGHRSRILGTRGVCLTPNPNRHSSACSPEGGADGSGRPFEGRTRQAGGEQSGRRH